MPDRHNDLMSIRCVGVGRRVANQTMQQANQTYLKRGFGP